MTHRASAATFIIALALQVTAGASTSLAIELLHYTFDQVDSVDQIVFTTPDASGRGNTGTLTSMDNVVPVPGRVGNALQFSGTGSGAPRDRVEILNPEPNPDPVTTDLNRTYTQFTFAAFVKPVGIAATETDTIFIGGKMGSPNAANPNRRGWQIGLVGPAAAAAIRPNEIVVSLFEGPTSLDNDNEYYSGPQTAVVNDQWAHLAFTFSSALEATPFFRMYLNGVKVVDEATDLLQMNGLNTMPFQVGNRGDQRADSWQGLIDDVYLFDHVLTDAEIMALIPPLPPANAGDFNNNGVVDAADYVTWRENQNGVTALPNDNNLGTPIGNAHYDLWRGNFGAPGGGSGSGPVPEPTPATLVVACAIFASGIGLRAQRVS